MPECLSASPSQARTRPPPSEKQKKKSVADTIAKQVLNPDWCGAVSMSDWEWDYLRAKPEAFELCRAVEVDDDITAQQVALLKQHMPHLRRVEIDGDNDRTAAIKLIVSELTTVTELELTINKAAFEKVTKLLEKMTTLRRLCVRLADSKPVERVLQAALPQLEKVEVEFAGENCY